MKEEDLMIGNYIYFEDDKLNMTTIGKIESIIKEEKYTSIRGIDQWGDKFEDSIIDIEPIPITEEIILRCGFKYSKTSDKYFEYKDQYAISTANDKFDFIIGNFICTLILTELKYLHALQNLIYLLTKEELEVKI